MYKRQVYGCAVSPDGARIVSASIDETLKLWDAATGAELRTLSGHTDGVWGCAFSPDGAFVVSASWDNTLKLWDAATGRELRTLSGHTGAVYGCAVSPDGAFVVSASGDNRLKVWDAATGGEILSVPLLGSLDCVALHPSQPLMACGDQRGSLYLLDLIGIEYGPIVADRVGSGDARKKRWWQRS